MLICKLWHTCKFNDFCGNGKTGDLVESVNPCKTCESGDFFEITNSHESDDFGKSVNFMMYLVNLVILVILVILKSLVILGNLVTQ